MVAASVSEREEEISEVSAISTEKAERRASVGDGSGVAIVSTEKAVIVTTVAVGSGVAGSSVEMDSSLCE